MMTDFMRAQGAATTARFSVFPERPRHSLVSACDAEVKKIPELFEKAIGPVNTNLNFYHFHDYTRD